MLSLSTSVPQGLLLEHSVASGEAQRAPVRGRERDQPQPRTAQLLVQARASAGPRTVGMSSPGPVPTSTGHSSPAQPLLLEVMTPSSMWLGGVLACTQPCWAPSPSCWGRSGALWGAEPGGSPWQAPGSTNPAAQPQPSCWLRAMLAALWEPSQAGELPSCPARPRAASAGGVGPGPACGGSCPSSCWNAGGGKATGGTQHSMGTALLMGNSTLEREESSADTALEPQGRGCGRRQSPWPALDVSGPDGGGLLMRASAWQRL